MQCIGVKACGLRCSIICLEGSRCKIHEKTLNYHGPNTTRRRELKFIHDRNTKEIRNKLRTLTINIDQHNAQQRLEGIRYQTAQHELETIITNEIAELGRDPDIDAIHRRMEERRRVREMRERVREMRRQERLQRNIQADQELIQQNNLRVFAQDNQNVHTRIIVEKVKTMVEKILVIPVPPEYFTETLKTPGEIIMECNLTKRAAWQMMSKYCEEVDIYELGIGIYPTVLNSVWQYIKNSEHKEDLKKILCSEMEDNIGMCQQGNLSRLCNILSGYLDGLIVDEKTPKDIFVEKISAITSGTHIERFIAAQKLLEEYNIPQDEWEGWQTAVLEN
jgi:hypothetical protein